MRAARYLGVAPWDLEEQELKWLHRARIAQWAEQYAENEATARESARAWASRPKLQ